MKNIIYDFDGTLTRSSYPIYPIMKEALKRGGFNTSSLLNGLNIIGNKIKKSNHDPYERYYDMLIKFMEKAGIPVNNETLSFGATDVNFNHGVDSFFERFSDFNHFVVTSGLETFVKNTRIANYFDEIKGTNIRYVDDCLKAEIIKDSDKPSYIEMLTKGDISKTIYIGDGATDIPAFEYVHKNGGVSIYVGDKNLTNKKIIDAAFEPDYRKGSSLCNYIKSLKK